MSSEEVKFERWDGKRSDGKRHDEVQTEILAKSFQEGGQSLDALLGLMREQGEAVIYLCGSRLDNDYCLGSHDISFAISVLPQDGCKAARPSYHPGSTEVYVAFQGSLIIESLHQGSIKSEVSGQFNFVVIPPGQCHRVRYEPQREAASLIVKTNPHHEPKAVRCDNCTYYRHPEEDCILCKSWLQEQEIYKESKWACPSEYPRKRAQAPEK
jgi:hypothetical protein